VIDLLAPLPPEAKSACLAVLASQNGADPGLIKNIARSHGGVSVFGGVGERHTAKATTSTTSSRNPEYQLRGSDPKSKVALCFGQMNRASRCSHARGPFSALTNGGKHFRDVTNQDSCSSSIIIFPLRQAGFEVAPWLGPHCPSAVGYQPTLAPTVGDAPERITCHPCQAPSHRFRPVYVPARRS